MYIKTDTYELLQSFADSKSALAGIAAATEKVNGVVNTFSGTILADGHTAFLHQKNAAGFKKYKVEIREWEGISWLKISIGPGYITIIAGAALLLLSIAALVDLPVHDIVLPAGLSLFYIHILSYNKEANQIGLMIDPLYFNSPEAQGKPGKANQNTISGFNTAYILFIVMSIILSMAYMYFKMSG